MARAEPGVHPRPEKRKRKHKHKKPLNLNQFQQFLPESRFDAPTNSSEADSNASPQSSSGS